MMIIELKKKNSALSKNNIIKANKRTINNELIDFIQSELNQISIKGLY
jgi:hypothetical protein